MVMSLQVEKSRELRDFKDKLLVCFDMLCMLIPTQLFLIPFIEYFFLESDSRIDGSQILIMIFEDYYIVLKFIFHGLSGIFFLFLTFY